MSKKPATLTYYEDAHGRIWTRTLGGWSWACGTCGCSIQKKELESIPGELRPIKLDAHSCEEFEVEKVMDS